MWVAIATTIATMIAATTLATPAASSAPTEKTPAPAHSAVVRGSEPWRKLDLPSPLARLRLITALQQQAVLLAQRHGRRRIGDYFLESAALRPADMEHLGRAFCAHNARIALSR